MARDGSGNLWLYPGNGRGGLTTRARLGTGWNTMSSIVALATSTTTTTPTCWPVTAAAPSGSTPATGAVEFDARRKVGADWNVFTTLAGPEQVGSLVNVLARDRDGYMVAYGVVGDGRFDGNLVGDIGRGVAVLRLHLPTHTPRAGMPGGHHPAHRPLPCPARGQ